MLHLDQTSTSIVFLGSDKARLTIVNDDSWHRIRALGNGFVNLREISAELAPSFKLFTFCHMVSRLFNGQKYEHEK